MATSVVLNTSAGALEKTFEEEPTAAGQFDDNIDARRNQAKKRSFNPADYAKIRG